MGGVSSLVVGAPDGPATLLGEVAAAGAIPPHVRGAVEE
jgi:hypothetical protein